VFLLGKPDQTTPSFLSIDFLPPPQAFAQKEFRTLSVWRTAIFDFGPNFAL